MQEDGFVTTIRQDDLASTGPGRAVTAETPDHFGDARYARERLLGEGGMGRVHLVEDAIIGRRVALKELGTDRRTDEVSRKRFYREALVQGQLEHPAIVPVYDVGVGDDGSPFFTMKRVRGNALDEILVELAAGRPSSFTRGKLLTAFAQLCLAVQYAHERGVVHRDIKPANVMLGKYGEVYLLDWGVAKVATEHDGELPAVAHSGVETQVGSIVGTLVTMAPEQARGEEVDGRADVYALGAVLFEILTFEPLHPVGSAREMLRAIEAGVEARPSVRRPELAIAPELEAIVVAATQRDREARTPTALAVHDALQAYLEGDRDLALRRASALAHLEEARRAAEEAFGSPAAEATRERALREVGRALALDPENQDAVAILVRLLTSPPERIPREVAAEVIADSRRNIQRGAVVASAFYLILFAWGIWSWLLGPTDLVAFVGAHVGWGLALAASVAMTVLKRRAWMLATFVFGTATSVWVTRVFGPFLVVPVLISVHAAVFALVRSTPARIASVVLSCVAWSVAVFGALGGLFPDVLRIGPSEVVMHLPFAHLDTGEFGLFLYFAGLASVLAPAIVIGIQQSSSTRSDLQMRLQAWQLRRLVGRDASLT